MWFITTQDSFCQEYGGHHVYKAIEGVGTTPREMVWNFIRDEVRPHDMDSFDDEVFEIRMDDGTCFAVNYSAWVEHEPDWHICDHAEIKEISADECTIKEAPRAFMTWEVEITDVEQVKVDEDSVILGVRVLSPATIYGKNSFRNSTGNLLVRENAAGVKVVRTYVSSFNHQIDVPLSVFLDNDCKIDMFVKSPSVFAAPATESPDDTPSPH